MRDIWFADKRDLVKWSVLFHLAEQFKSEYILQIAYYRPSSYGTITIDNKEFKLRQEVLNFFRDINKIKNIQSKAKIEVFDRSFDNRNDYQRAAIEFIRGYNSTRCIVFLDPDTGLQPATHYNYNHVLETEVRDIFRSLKSDDIFVFYQNQTNRNGQPWIEPKRNQLAQALELSEHEIEIAHGRDVAHDVAFYFIRKA